MVTSFNRIMMWAALLCSTALVACLPEEKDPTKMTDAGRINGSFYASSLGNMAVQIQNSVAGDPSWFTSASGSALNLAALGIDDKINGSTVLSHVCPTGSGTEVLHVTWVDGRDADNKFKLKGVGSDTGTLIGALRERVSADQVGSYRGNNNIETAAGTTLSIPGSCANIPIPEGAPVLAFRIERPAAPIQQLSKTEYRTLPCENDIRGKAQLGTRLQSRVVSYDSSGVITPSDPEAGWQTDNMNCTPDTIVTANGSSDMTAGTVQLNNFADLTANSLKNILQQQLEMGCVDTDIASDAVKKDSAGKDTHVVKSKNINTCTKATASAAGQQVKDRNESLNHDSRDVCIEKGTTYIKPFLGVPTGTLYSNISGTAWVDRRIDKVGLTTGTGSRGEREKWIGRPAINCRSDETYVANCANVPGAPAGPDMAGAGSKWDTQNIANYGNNEAWYNKILNFCFIGCTYATGGGAYTLNWNYFNSKQTLHSAASTTRAVGARLASNWLDAIKYFTPNFVFQPFNVPAATNQCLIRTREIQLDCPLSYNASKQAGWAPYELPAGTGNFTTLIPGGSYGGDVGGAYNSVRNKGDTPGLVWLNWKECNIKGCDSWTDYAGPGTNAYIKSWTYSDTSSYNGISSTVQTIMMNKDGQMADYQPAIMGTTANPTLRYKGRYTVPLHCGRIEKATYNAGWPVYVRYWSCGGKGGCWLNGYYTSTTITQTVTREWLGDNTVDGTWSIPVAVYSSAYGSWSNPGAIPNPIIVGP